MTDRDYVSRLTKAHVGRRVEAPTGDVWAIRGVVKKTAAGSRTWVAGLQHAAERRRYREEEVDTIVNGNWVWADEEEPSSNESLATATDTAAPRDDEGRRLCERCGEPIAFITMQGSGKAMPVDHGGLAAADALAEMEDEVPTGLVTRGGKTLTRSELERAAEADLTVYRSHFVTCPDAEHFH